MAMSPQERNRPGLVFAVLVIAALAAAPALAAGPGEIVLEPEIVAPAAPDPAERFSGFYLGGAAGYAFGGDDRVGVSGGGAMVNAGTLEAAGGFGALHAGYRWRNGARVFGAELGIEAGDVGAEAAALGYASSVDLKHAVTLSATGGLMVTDRLLVYGLAGLAHGEFDYTVSGAGGAGTAAISETVGRSGYVLGLGLERALSGNWSVRGEYRYSNFGKETLSGPAGTETNATPDYHSVRVGVNFRF